MKTWQRAKSHHINRNRIYILQNKNVPDFLQLVCKMERVLIT